MARLLHAAHLVLLLTTTGCGARSALDAGQPAADGGPPGSSTSRLILFGGWEGQSEAGDTWAFDGAAWTQLQPYEAPTARNSSAVAAVGEQIVLFSGTNDGLGDPGIQTDMWTFAGDTWSPRATAHVPPGRSYGNAAALGGAMVLFSGFQGAGPQNDTWVWNGADWTLAVPSAPEGQAGVSPGWRNAAAMATLGDGVVLFGGYGGDPENPSDIGDTWTWNGTAWTQRSPSISPSVREWATVATLGDRVVLFGGSNDGGLLGDTWIWDGVAWTEETPAQSPPARWGAAAATLGGQVILFGGATTPDAPDLFLSDTWAWDGTTWTQLPADGPTARALAMMAPQ